MIKSIKGKMVKGRMNILDFDKEACVALLECSTSQDNHFKVYDLTDDRDAFIYASLRAYQMEHENEYEKGVKCDALVRIMDDGSEKLIQIVPRGY